MRFAVVVLIAHVGCGRWNFDPFGDAGSDGARAVPACQPRGGQILLRLTLDDALSIQQPAVGAPNAVVASVSDFVEGRCGNALRLDALGEVLEVDQLQAGTTHVDFTSGALEMWYRPQYDVDDGQEHRLFGNTDFSGGGGILIAKANAADNNALRVEARDASGAPIPTTQVAASDVPFATGVWVHVAVTWNFAAPVGIQAVRIYFDGIEPGYQLVATGPATMRTANDSQSFFVGAYDVDNPESAQGELDEVIVYGDP